MPFSLLAPAAALKTICINLQPDKQLNKPAEARNVFVPAVLLLRLGIAEADLETLTCSTLNQYRHVRTASIRLLTAMAALLLLAIPAGWRDAWPGELHILPMRRSRSRSTAHTLFGVPRSAETRRRPAFRSRQARP
jgi:hypothetical protein